MSFQPLESYEFLKEHKSETFEIVVWHFGEIIQSVHRKISLKQKFSEPFTCLVVREVYPKVFYEIIRAIRDYKIKLGVETSVSRNSKNQVAAYSVKFTHIGVFQYHFGQLSNKGKEEISALLNKTFSYWWYW